MRSSIQSCRLKQTLRNRSLKIVSHNQQVIRCEAERQNQAPPSIQKSNPVPHPPAKPGSGSDDGTVATDRTDDRERRGDVPDEDDGTLSTEAFRPVFDAIRRCRRERVPANAEAIARRVEGMGLADVLGMLGEMEMAGAIVVHDGVVAPARRSGG